MATEAPPVPPDAAEQAARQRSAIESAVLALFAASAMSAGESDEQEADLSSIDVGIIRRLIGLHSIGIALMILRGAGLNPAMAEVEAIAKRINDDDSLTREMVSFAGKLRRHTRDSPPRGVGELSLQREAARAFATHAYGSIAARLASALPQSPLADQFKNLVMKKTWITQGDSRVRPLHRRLHARTKRFDEDFWRWPTTGARLRFPGDPEAPLDATIGCRCILWISWSKPNDLSTVIRRLVG